MLLPRLSEDSEEADNHCEEGNTFDQSSSNNHSGTDCTGGFGLAGNAFHCSLTDFADAQTGANGGKACADTGTKDSDEFRCLSSHFQ